MSPRLREPFGTHGKVHEITAQPAGWRYVGFSLYRLREGERAAEATGVNEAILVMIEGKAAIRAAGKTGARSASAWMCLRKPRRTALMFRTVPSGRLSPPPTAVLPRSDRSVEIRLIGADVKLQAGYIASVVGTIEVHGERVRQVDGGKVRGFLRKWRARRDSNPRPSDSKSDALSS